MQIRPATPSDAEAIARVHIASWQAGYAGLLPADVLAGLALGDWTERRRKSLTGGNRTLLAEGPAHDPTDGSPVLGFTAFGPRRSDPDPDGTKGGELFALYVHPDHWGAGVGAALINSATVELDAVFRHSILWVLRDNARARRFYAANGWRPDGAAKVDTGPGGAVLNEIRYRRERADTPPGALSGG